MLILWNFLIYATIILSFCVQADLATQLKLVLLKREVIKAASSNCGPQYGLQINALKSGMKEVLDQAHDRRNNLDVEKFIPDTQAAEFIGEQMCKNGRFTDGYLHKYLDLYSSYSPERYTMGTSEDALSDAIAPPEENQTDPFDQSSQLVETTFTASFSSIQLVSTFCFGVLVGFVVFHYYTLVRNTAPGLPPSKIRRPEL